ncbi:MAG: TerB family tellurite resistance protein [Planctomycetes bacterium]|nr:TerB family tellurite resistance protein [Planctomycetota bacterium]
MSMNAAERMNLMRFVCSFVWTDLKVAQAERDLVMRIAGRLSLTEPEVAQVSAWLRTPPDVEDIDPTSIPRAHRQLFLQAAELAVKVDGRVVPVEAESLALFRELLSD